ncbi:hypothetical protein TRVL_03595 [Trypanosoma vivax]|nr:hypothetical protein TRVL_03595 [Trypanosoma vivax]
MCRPTSDQSNLHGAVHFSRLRHHCQRENGPLLLNFLTVCANTDSCATVVGDTVTHSLRSYFVVQLLVVCHFGIHMSQLPVSTTNTLVLRLFLFYIMHARARVTQF